MEALRTTQWPCMRISESAKTPRAMRIVRRLSARQAPTANAPHCLYTQCASSDSIGPLPDAFAAPQSLYAHTHTEPQQAARTMRRADTHCAALKRSTSAQRKCVAMAIHTMRELRWPRTFAEHTRRIAKPLRTHSH